MKKPIKNGKEVFAVLSMATVMSISVAVKADAASTESNIDSAAENAYTETIIDDITRRGYADFAEASQELKATDFIGLGGELEFGDEIIPAALRAPQEPTDPNYAKDEENVGTYKETQLERGNGPAASYTPPVEMDKFIDGFRYKTLEPSPTSDDKTLWGYEIEFDRDEGQRTYTDFYFTNTGRLGNLLNVENIPANDVGKAITDGFKEPNYKPDAFLEITESGTQRNLNGLPTENDLIHINNINNKNTMMSWEGRYTAEPFKSKLKATEGPNALFAFTVNPWPNENDKLNLIYLNGDYDKKEFVKGQTINTGIKVENLDENARERLVGQVYHPVSGEVVPGAEAYIDANDMVVVKMPEGALKQDANGKTVINGDSIFSKAGYKNIQSLDVKFFARPRTEAEFKAVSDAANYGEGAYTPTGAGTEVINHKGQSVTIDKQGIARYDHYNKVGEFKINLDDTMYYDQRFEDGNGDDTTQVDISDVQPGVPFEVKIVQPANPGETDKSAEDMNGAQDRGEASGELNLTLFDKENKGKAPEDQWKIDVKGNDISKFIITPPASAKAGDSVAVAVKYTYTNGSTDLHWFHFVVQDSTYIKPEYDAQVNFPINKQISPATWTEDGKRIPPSRFTLPDTLETDDAGNKLATDDKGNKWTVAVDETTGEVTAKPVNPDDFDGGEKLTVPVIAHYEDPQKPGEDITENVNAYFVIEEKANMTPRYNAKAGKSGDVLTSDIILNEEDTYNRRPTKFTLDSDTFVDDKGNTWNVKIDENTGKVTATVPNAEEGQSIDGALLNVPVTAHYYEEDEDGNIVEAGTKQTEVQFVAYGTDGTKTHTEEIPFEYDIQYDPDFYKNYPDAKDNYKVVTEGVPGEKTTTWTIKDSQIVGEPKVETKDPVNAVIKVGQKDYTGNFTTKKTTVIEFETEYRVNNELKPGEVKEIQKGELGKEETTVTHTIVNGEVTKSEEGETKQTKAPVKRIVEVGPGTTDGTHTYTNKIPFDVEVRVNPELKKGESKVIQKGEVGEEEYTITIENSKVTKTSDPVVTKEAKKEIIEVGSQEFEGEVKHVEELPFKYKVEESDELKPGEYKIVKPGKVGTKTTTWTIKDSKVVGEPKEEIVEAEDALIQVGKGTPDSTFDFTEKKELPFETIIEYDDSLEPGEEKVVQEGKPGEQERTNTIVIENGKVKEIKEGTFETTTEPVNKIIKIGKKKTEGETTKTIEREIPYETKVIYDETLDAGFQQIEKEGKPGKEKVTITTKIVDGKLVTTESTEKIEDKEDRVVRVGVKPVTKETELGHDTEYKYNPELKEGEEKVIEEGSNGKVEYTITFNKKTGKIEVSEKRIEPKNKIVEIGYKTDGEVKVESEIPFEVEIIEDPEMEAGETKVVQEGKLGKKETTITIENSKEVSRDEDIIKEPVKKIIKVGTKNVCEIPPVKPGEDPKDPDQPGEEDPKDPEKPGEEDPKDDDKPGHEDHEKPEKPGHEDHEKPYRPSHPGENWPWTPREDDPKNPPLVSHEKPKFEIEVKKDDKDPEMKEDEEVKVSENEELKETEENKALEEDQKDQIEETEEENNGIDNDDEREVTKKGRAPKTNDPGIALETASAGLASALLLLLRRFKRRK